MVDKVQQTSIDFEKVLQYFVNKSFSSSIIFRGKVIGTLGDDTKEHESSNIPIIIELENVLVSCFSASQQE